MAKGFLQKRANIVSTLRTVINAIDIKDQLLIGTDSFIFADEYIHTYSNRTSFSYPLKTGVNCTVKAIETLKILEKMKSEDVTFKQNPDNLEISGDNTTLKMTLIEEDANIRKLINSFDMEDLVFHNLPKDFIEGIKLCSYSMSQDPNVIEINGLAFKEDSVWSTDIYRNSQYKFEESLDIDFTIPAPSVNILLKMIYPPIEYAVGNGWIHFKCENNIIFSSNEIMKPFPSQNLIKIFKSYEDDFEEYTFPKGLEECLDVAGILASVLDKDDPVLNVEIYRKGKRLYVKGQNANGKVEDSVEIDGNMFDEGVSFKISPTFLKTILSTTRNFSIADESVMIFKTPTFKHLMSKW